MGDESIELMELGVILHVGISSVQAPSIIPRSLMILMWVVVHLILLRAAPKLKLSNIFFDLANSTYQSILSSRECLYKLINYRRTVNE